MTSSFRASSYQAFSRMAPESIYTSYNSPAYSIFKQSSSSSTSSSKFVSFASAFISPFTMSYTSYSDSPNKAIIQKSTLKKSTRLLSKPLSRISISESIRAIFERLDRFIHDNTYEFRQSSFDQIQWFHQSPSAKHCILAGFKINIKNDETNQLCCHTCGITISIEDINDEYSLERHVRLSPSCEWLCRNKEEIIATIQAEHDEEDRIEAEEARLAKERAELLQQQQAEQARIAKEQEEARLTAFACRRCSAKFSSNTKLHIHVQDHHQKKPIKPADEPANLTPSELAVHTSNEPAKSTTSEPAETASIAELTFSATSPLPSEPTLVLTSSISHSESTSKISLSMTPPATPIATPRKPIFWAEIVSRPVIASKPSRLPIPTPKKSCKSLETAAVVCPPTSLPTPPQKPVPEHQHHEQKLYLTIEDLFEMFAEKRTKPGLLHTKKTEFFPKVSRQSKIISYFRPAANQSKPISQGSKIPNPRSFHQHMPAKAIRNTPSKWSEKSAILPYKMPSISRFQPMAALCKSTARLPVSSIPRACLNISGSRHVCRICSGIFGSNNGLHRHLRAIHFSQAPRRQFENPRECGHPGCNLGDS